ncbi:hypothetical protein JHK86_051182 [Glycine max]|nr:hypothetical protein JHK86_051182 [Glycine max]
MDPITSATAQSALQIAEHVVKRQVGYIFNYKDKFKEVEQYIERLDNTRKRVQNEVNDAEKNGEEINDEVQHWLKQVDEKIKKYECFINDERHAQTRCSIRLIFPNNLSLRYRLGRKATKMVEEIKADGHSNKKFDKVSYRLGPSSDAALLNTGYVSFGSRNETMEKIMKALEDSTVNIVGVYGAGGVGKTTLVKEVANKAREKKLFNMVIMTNVTRIPDIRKIQEQIAEMLGMRLEEKSEIVRADRIRKRLMKEKENTLIILEDLWDGLNLNILGIPRSEDDDGSQQDVNDLSDFGYNKMEKEVFSADLHTMKKEKLAVDFKTMKKGKLSFDSNMIKKEKLSGDHKGCKILLTSRSKEVICNKMDVQERSTFSVGVLEENEAQTLLKKEAGINVQSFEFDEKVIEIAKMCDGLPIGLVSIGRALKNKSPFVWQDVCQQIKRQSFTEGHKSIEFTVKLSYDHLKNEQLKHIFLLCARMGNDALIMNLVKLCIGLGLLQGVHTIREARNKVNMLIEELKESTLLRESYSRDRFNMHDIVRDVALSISSKEKHVFFMKNGILDEWPHKDELERYTAICLHFCDINDGLPESIHCPRLEVLHIDSKGDFMKIPDEFFKDMIELRVLILTGVNLSCLPSSIKCLKKLRMLSLERCTLGEKLSIVGELKKLRILTLSGSKFESLPLEFGQLAKLQLFDLSNCSNLRVIPSNIISRMNSLEEFYMRDSLILWEAEENIQSQKASLSELRHLNHLRNLDVHIQSVSHFPQNLFLDMLDSYKIVIGEFNMLTEGEFKIPDMYDKAKFLALNLKEGIDIHSETWVKMLFKSVEYLFLGELNDVHDVFYELNVEGFPYLKHLSIVNNFGIQYIINSVERFHPLLAFPKLESMCLYKLDNLEKICGNNQLEEASFCRLKVIKIKTCDKLENIFPFFMVRLLALLETIEVCDCDSLKEIVSVERQTHTINDDKIEFPQLRLLTLKSLPSFASFYSNDKMPCSAQSLEVQVQNRNKDIIIEVEPGAANSCISLFNEKVSIPKLEWLELSSIRIQKIWSDQSPHYFQNLLTLNVTDCGDLKYLLSFSMAGSLMNLQSLFVCACEMMEDIFCPEHAENIDVFPKLKKMEIICMEKLNTIWQPHIGLHSFHSLDSLIIGECHKLVTIFPSYMEQRFQSLQSLTITNCQLVENIFDFEIIPQTGVRNETNLQNVFLKALPNLVHIWKEDSSEILKYNNLKSISINESPNLKHLFPLSVATDLEKLEILDVYNCRAMKEIVAWGNGSNENAITFKFPQLNTVSLQNSFELVSFYRGTHALEWPSLKKLSILNCFKLEGLTKDITNSQWKPIVSATEKVIYNLESMEISLKEAEWLQKYIVSVHRMHKLQILVLYGLENTEIPFWFLHRLPNLKSLTLGSSQLKRIWAPASLISRDKIGVVMQLKELELKSLLSLEEIGFEHHPLLQRIERLVISRCLKLTNLASSKVSFSYMTHLEVMNCRSMRSLMTSSTAKSLVQLTTMKVSFCEMIVEIVAENEEEKVQEIEFRQLKCLELVSLQNFTGFSSSEKCNFKFPLLESLVVSECPQIMKNFSIVQSAPAHFWEGDLNDTLQKHFRDKVSFGYSKHRRTPLPENFFVWLKKLEFDGAIKREIVIPSHVLPCLKTIQELKVHSSDAVQIIFDMDDSEANTKGVFRLKKITLEGLSNLKCVWNKNPRGSLSFRNLQEVIVLNCRSLATLFPLSLARNLGKLKTLEIQICHKLVEIVGKEDAMEHGITEIFEFPYLRDLFLNQLSLLSCFYPGKHHLECPLLKRLRVRYCPKLKLFTSEIHNNHKEAVTEAPISRLQQQPLFSVDKIVPNLKELTLNEENIMLLNDAHLPQDLLFKLNFLGLSYENDDNKIDTLPFDFLQKVPSLEHLALQRCYGLKEIFPFQKLQVHDRSLPGLKQLMLVNLRELESIGLEHPWVKPYSQKLQILIVRWCPRLDQLVSCAVSFINLKQLEVTCCNRMEYLLKCSTAQSLLQLESLSISECESMKEIVKKEEEDASDEIIFGSLRTIMLDSLPRLVRFYSGNATLHLTCLRVATIAECQNMKTFSEGIIDAPLLEGIKTSTEDTDLTSHHDLNTTIQTLFHQQHMILVDYLGMTDFMHGKPAFPENFFDCLKKLEFDGANKREIVIPSHVLPCLNTLEELNVHSSDAAQVIFDMDDSEANTKGIVFRLKKLTLKALSNLKCVWNKTPQGILGFPNLQAVNVQACVNLVTLFPLSLARNLGKLQILEIQNCYKLVEIIGKEHATEHATTEMFEFPFLLKLLLYKLSLLSCFYPGKHHLQCPLLKILEVSYCPKLKLFTSEFRDCPKQAVIEAPISQLQQQPLFSVEKIVPNLKNLTLNEENILLLSDAHLPEDLLFKLTYLDISFEKDDIKKNTLPFDFLQKVPSLEHLRVERCYGLKEIFPSQKLQVHDRSLPRLNQLSLYDLEELESIGLEHPWVKPYSEKLQILYLGRCSQLVNLVSCAVSFINLKQLQVTSCDRMEYLLKCSTAKSLLQLESLSIRECESMKEIVKKEEEDGSDDIIFGSLRRIMLDSLPRLVRFYSGNATLHLTCLQVATIAECQKMKTFSEGIIDAPLFEGIKTSTEDTDLTSHHDLNTTIQTLFQQQIVPNMKELTPNEEDTLPFDFLQKVLSSEHVVVQSCYGLKEIFPSQKLQVHDRTLPGLKQLTLYDLDLESIGLEHPWVKPYSQKLQILNLRWCPRLEELVSCKVSFINLKELEVTYCKRMEYLLKCSTAQSLLQLERLSIRECESMKEIVKKEEEDASDEIIFGRLRRIMLDSLPRLVRFYSGNATLHFKCLEEATIAECQNMETFSEGIIDAPLLEGIKTSTEDTDLTSHHDLNTTIQTLFHQQHMILVHYLGMTDFMHGKPAFPENFFDCLKKLEFDGANKREIVIPSHVLPYLKTLEELYVHSSDAAQVIFDIDDTDANTKGMVLLLKTLTLEGLSNLKCVWNKTPRGILCFPNLQEVIVVKCRSLATLLPLSLAKNLVNLQTLTVWRCDKLVEFVGKEDAMEHGTTEIFEFPSLWKLVLHELSLISCFYPGKHHLECPILKSLLVCCCPKLKLFTSEIHNNHKEAVTEAPISQLQQQPLFSVDKIVPNLEELRLNEENIMLLSDAHLPEDLLFKLTYLDLSFEKDDIKKDTLPFDFLEKVPSLEHLRVERCYGLKEIFPSQKLQVHDRSLSRLNQLSLYDLEELESIGLEHPWVKPYSENLQILIVRWCPRLDQLVSCADSFFSLKHLSVSHCKRMEYLLKCSTVSLFQLESLSISECESMKEIVKEEEEDASAEIVFPSLRTIMLDSLPRLVRFYSGNATLYFMRLEEATIAECQNMKTFSEGIIEAPLLEGIKTSTEDTDLTSHHDLNTTIQTLFHQQVEKSACDIENLKFGDHHHLEEIWLGVVPIPSNNCFNSLKSLIVVECESLSNVIPFYLLRFLCNLKEIEVSNCQSVKAIFDMEGTEVDMKPASQISLPLKKLILNQLPNLEHIWNLNPDEILSFQEFQEVCISNCQSLKSLFTTSVASHLAMLDVRSCATLEEIFVENEAVMKGETKQFNFHCLTTLTLWELPELKYFYNGKHLLEWPMLTQLDVYHCDKLKLFTTEHHSGEVADIEYPLCTSIDQQAVFSVEKVMPSLEHQANTCKDNMIGQGQFVANAAHLLQNLKVVKLMCYHEDDESNIFSSGLLEEISSIENLEVFCSSFNEIFSCQMPSTNYTIVLSKLKKLHLKSLQQLNSIGLEHSWVEPLLKTLETLEVFSCPNMRNLVSSTVSFSNLTSLNVEECHGLVYLFTSSTAKSLGQLKHMSIRDCQAIQEIVSKEGDHESNDEEITFEQLRVLSLESLPSIVGIYSGTYKLKFPSLDQVTLMECPQMKYSYVPDLHQFKPLEQI